MIRYLYIEIMYDAAYANYAASSLRAKVAGDTLHSNSGLLRGLVKNAYYGFKGDKAAIKGIKQQQVSDIAYYDRYQQRTYYS